jgi:recombination protein RecT
MAGNLAVLKNMMRQDEVKKRFEEVLKEQAPTFMASIVNAVSSNPQLQACDPMTIWGAGMIAASLKLPVDPNLGFAYIIPYNDRNRGQIAQFQMGYKGYIQLGMRSGQYRRMHVSEVYADELDYHNPITGEIKFTPMNTWKLREEGKQADVIGYYAMFELLNGYIKEDYWTISKVTEHGKKYSQTFKKGFGKWVDDFDAMAKKTVIKNLLSRWGVLSVEMQKAIETDQASTDGDNLEYPDNKEEKPESALEKHLKEGKQDEADSGQLSFPTSEH